MNNERPTEGFQANNRDIPGSLRLLQELQPPKPSPKDTRDPVEAQIYTLLGDITLPRSLLSALNALSREKHAVTVEYLKAIPEKQIAYRKSSIPGQSPEADEGMIAKETGRIFNELLSRSAMTDFRDKAGDLFSHWTQSNIRHSSLSEAYYLRESYRLWERMKAYVKDFLVFGHRATIDVETSGLEDVISFVKKVVAMQTENQQASVIFSTKKTHGKLLSSNELILQKNNGRITGLRFNEFVGKDETSPLEKFFQSLSSEDTVGLATLGGWEVVGPFRMTHREHAWGGNQRFAGLDAGSLGEEEIYNFIGKYVSSLKNF